MAIPSQGFDESTQSQMLTLETVKECKVYDNRSDEVVNGIPAHGIWVIVRGGLPQEIGRVIYNNLPPGIPMKGSEQVIVNKINGDIEKIFYDVAKPTNLYVRATIKNFTQTDLDEDYIKQQLSESEYQVAEQAESATLLGLIKETLGDTGTPYDVEISIDNSNWVEYVSPTGMDEYFVITPENITLTVV